MDSSDFSFEILLNENNWFKIKYHWFSSSFYLIFIHLEYRHYNVVLIEIDKRTVQRKNIQIICFKASFALLQFERTHYHCSFNWNEDFSINCEVFRDYWYHPGKSSIQWKKLDEYFRIWDTDRFMFSIPVLWGWQFKRLHGFNLYKFGSHHNSIIILDFNVEKRVHFQVYQ